MKKTLLTLLFAVELVFNCFSQNTAATASAGINWMTWDEAVALTDPSAGMGGVDARKCGEVHGLDCGHKCLQIICVLEGDPRSGELARADVNW